MSGKRGKEVAAQQIKLLKDPDKIVRYWGALGLRSQSAAVLKPFEKEIIASLKDEYPPVASTISAIAFDIFKNPQTAENLKTFVQSDNAELALMTINYLLYIDDKKPFIETIKTLQTSKKEYPDENKSRGYKVRAASMDFLGILGLVPNNPDFAE